MKYYAVKRKAKQFQRDLEEKVSCDRHLKDEEENISNEENSNSLSKFSNYEKTTIITAINKIRYDHLGINVVLLIVRQILC
jgi:hypothetical protein